ncbi:hypothetical protein CVT24_001389 [Panaeolus cyanescens]|uniref:Peptidase C14 caspase domain-containing protein n=1 Tax=Panaeolus cyanescens TaxID=181874 RepID=A0A409YZ60_9AGAR|nr:hypothetical protein CVT24_001389 [Panaeolus cyanescens]
MKIVKQKLNPLGWLNLKVHHTLTPHPTPQTPSTPHFGVVHASSASSHPSSHPQQPPQGSSSNTHSKPQRPPRKKALLIGIAELPPPEPSSVQDKAEGFASPTRRQEVMIPDSPLPITPGREGFALVNDRAGRKSGSGPKPVTKNGGITAAVVSKTPLGKNFITAHNDVALMNKALTSWYGYKPADITILMDDNEPGRRRPTRENILAAIDRLVKDVEPGDTVFFHFSGNGTQQDTKEIDEEDGKNEVMLTCDGDRIIDNELHERLVKPLPEGSKLIAVCDACHSGSLLDLQHFRCNGVYVPWVNKGERRSRIEQNATRRRQARISTTHALAQHNRDWAPSTIDQILKPNTSSSSNTFDILPPSQVPKPHGPSSLSKEFEHHSRAPPPPPTSKSTSSSHSRSLSAHPSPSAPPRPTRTHRLNNSLSIATDVVTTSSGKQMPWLSNLELQDDDNIFDTPQNLYCTGFCHSETDKFAQSLSVVGSKPHADVICLSSASDHQRAWNSKGRSMTYQLYQILKRNHNPTLPQLLTAISHSLHKSCLKLHCASWKYRYWSRKQGLTQKRETELDNFQEPVLSSFVPLDRSKIWDP